MFSRFMENSMCMKVATWFLDRGMGPYDAAVIAYDCECPNITLFTEILIILNGVGMIGIDESSEDLRVFPNEDSLIFQSLKNLRETFDDEAYSNPVVASAFMAIENMKTLEDMMETIFYNKTKNEIIEIVKNYKNMEFDESPFISTMQKDFQERLEVLDGIGQLDLFIKYLSDEE